MTTLVAVLGSGAAAVGTRQPADLAANVTVEAVGEVPSGPIEAGSVIAQAWSRARRHGSVYTLVDADPIGAVVAEWGRRLRGDASDLEVAIGTAAGTLPDYYLISRQATRSRDPLVPGVGPLFVVESRAGHRPRPEGGPRDAGIAAVGQGIADGGGTGRASAGLGPAPRAIWCRTAPHLLMTAGTASMSTTTPTTRNRIPAPNRSHSAGTTRSSACPNRAASRRWNATNAERRREEDHPWVVVGGESYRPPVGSCHPIRPGTMAPKMVSAVATQPILADRLAPVSQSAGIEHCSLACRAWATFAGGNGSRAIRCSSRSNGSSDGASTAASSSSTSSRADHQRGPAASRMPFRCTINAYRGCSHACCIASRPDARRTSA